MGEPRGKLIVQYVWKHKTAVKIRKRQQSWLSNLHQHHTSPSSKSQGLPPLLHYLQKVLIISSELITLLFPWHVKSLTIPSISLETSLGQRPGLNDYFENNVTGEIITTSVTTLSAKFKAIVQISFNPKFLIGFFCFL